MKFGFGKSGVYATLSETEYAVLTDNGKFERFTVTPIGFSPLRFSLTANDTGRKIYHQNKSDHPYRVDFTVAILKNKSKYFGLTLAANLAIDAGLAEIEMPPYLNPLKNRTPKKIIHHKKPASTEVMVLPPPAPVPVAEAPTPIKQEISPMAEIFSAEKIAEIFELTRRINKIHESAKAGAGSVTMSITPNGTLKVSVEAE